MARVPISYNLRSLFVRKSSTALTVISIGATVAVLAGVLSLQQGFETLFSETGSEQRVVFLRPGATSESDSQVSPTRSRQLIKSVPELAVNSDGAPMASAETYLAVRLRKLDGGETNVPIRGVQPMSFELMEDELEVTEGRAFRPGADEIIVGDKLTRRIRGCQIGSTVQLNTTPFLVVGIFQHDGPYASEIWGDLDRISTALERPNYTRVIAQLRPEVDMVAFQERLAEHKEVPAKVLTEREFLTGQTEILSAVLQGLGVFLAFVMGLAAVFTATNTMQAALAARTSEIGILLSLGFRPFPIFLSFLLEALTLGVLGGITGILMTLPLNGVETGTTNFQTFTEVAFAFRLTPEVLLTAALFAILLGLAGGALPAWRAANRQPIDALRRA